MGEEADTDWGHVIGGFSPPRDMTDDAITVDLREIAKMRPTPSWAFKRMAELKAEKTRRLISLDGDIGRRERRASSQSPLK